MRVSHAASGETQLDRLATIEQAADMLGVSAPTIWRLIGRDVLHTRRVLGRAVIERAELEHVAAERAAGRR